MDIELEPLLRPVSAGAPCGPDLRELDAFGRVQRLMADVDRAGSTVEIDWRRERDALEVLARAGHDLRVWVWLTRSWLAADGLPGLVRGVVLIADGLERFWDNLPPIDLEEVEPGERFMGRLNALAALGVTSAHVKPDDLRASRGAFLLAGQLDAAMARAPAASPTPGIVAEIEAALARVEQAFKTGFGAARDPQLGFAMITSRLATLKSAVAAGSVPPAESSLSRQADAADHGLPVGSREDVLRALDQVLDYYRAHEPSSPVPLLVKRAKRLVPMSFLDAIKDLAPTGLKELQAVAGEDAKQPN